MSAPYSRENPSPFYQPLLDMYESMHSKGTALQGQQAASSEDTFSGKNLYPHVSSIRQLIKKHGATSILDYGAGKGEQYKARGIDCPDLSPEKMTAPEFWGITDIRLYEPATHNTAATQEKADGVISTDVLEHVHLADLPWVIEEMFSLANKFVFANICTVPAVALLPNGENAHISVRHPFWWSGLFHVIGSKYPDIDYVFTCDENYTLQQKDSFKYTVLKSNFMPSRTNMADNKPCFAYPIEKDLMVQRLPYEPPKVSVTASVVARS